MREKRNRLQGAVSPYLLQHAANPVDWFPWGSEAFDAAKAGDKPVFLSIGYSACHWCHVMAHECFEDEEVASLMNDAFISVKVDREELPHVDHAYMRVCQMMTGSGGWPLTIVMTPEKEPFFAATFLPKHTRNGLLGMMDLVPLLVDAWKTKRGKVSDLARRVSQAAAEYSPSSDGNPEESWLKSAYESLATRFQNDTGGFTATPKFPTPHHLMFLLRYFHRTGEAHALHMAEKTLDSMRRGGIYDHLGKGFHRYATDPLWRVPHFEKMLYDQALLAMTYTEAYLVTSRETYRKTAMQTLDYVLRDLKPEGILFASAQDADVSGEEGGYYLWTVSELRSLLKDDDYRLLSEAFAIEASGNFPEAREQGSNILFMRPSTPEAGQEIERILAILHVERRKREPPRTDDKALTDWNGLMIAALAKAGFTFGQGQYIDAARAAADFILKNMRDSSGRLLHVYRHGISAHRAGLDDYAFLIWGLIELYEATFENNYFHEALSLMHECISLFWDENQGGFFLTPEDSEVIIARMKEFADNAMPSGNSVAVHDLILLSRLTGEASFEEKAMAAVKACSGQIEAMPDAATFLMTGLDLALRPSREIVIAGSTDAAGTRSLLDVLASRFLPESVIAFTTGEVDKASPAIAQGKALIKGKAAAYVCRGLTCLEPVTDPADLARLLSF